MALPAGPASFAAALFAICAVASGAEGDKTVVTFTLERSLMNDANLNVFLVRQGGKVTAAFAKAPRYNTTMQSIDANGVKFDGQAVKGDLKVTLHCDGYVPYSGGDLECTYTLDARIKDGAIRGTYSGLYESDAKDGNMFGRTAAAAATPARLWYDIRINKAAIIEDPNAQWMARGSLRFVVDNGTVKDVQLVCAGRSYKSWWTVKVKKSALSVKDGKIAGTVDVVTEDGKGTSYKLDAAVIGSDIGGKVAVTRDGQTDEDYFVGITAPPDSPLAAPVTRPAKPAPATQPAVK